MKGSVAVVGSGINGLCCALLLSEAGHHVQIYDRDDIPGPRAASNGMHRLIHPWSDEVDSAIAPRAHRSLLLWQELLQKIRCDGLERTGVIAIPSPSSEGLQIAGIRQTNLNTVELGELCPFLATAEIEAGLFFQDFGVLYARRILHRLVTYLRERGVEMVPGRAVVDIDAATGEIGFETGERHGFDHVILAAGTGSGQILSRSLATVGPIPAIAAKRCYVAYLDLCTAPELSQTRVSWASLGQGDLWGMPELPNLPMKLGCGSFTRSGRPSDPDDADAVGQLILAAYQQRFPAFSGARVMRGGSNHWTSIAADWPGWRQDRLTVVASDNGAGFKFAPVTALEVVTLATTPASLTRAFTSPSAFPVIRQDRTGSRD